MVRRSKTTKRKAARTVTRRAYGRTPAKSLDGKWKRSLLEVEAARRLQEAGVPAWEEELRFDPDRRWRFDFAWPQRMVACEIQGGSWGGGRHTRGAGFESDCEKFNTATLAGWAVYKFTSKMVRSGELERVMEKALA